MSSNTLTNTSDERKKEPSDIKVKHKTEGSKGEATCSRLRVHCYAFSVVGQAGGGGGGGRGSEAQMLTMATIN